MKIAEHAKPIEGTKNINTIFVPIPEGKRLRGLTWHIREDNIKMELKEKQREGVNRIHLPQNEVQWAAVVNMLVL
jgi:N-glycosylase/DNA lyase